MSPPFSQLTRTAISLFGSPSSHEVGTILIDVESECLVRVNTRYHYVNMESPLIATRLWPMLRQDPKLAPNDAIDQINSTIEHDSRKIRFRLGENRKGMVGTGGGVTADLGPPSASLVGEVFESSGGAGGTSRMYEVELQNGRPEWSPSASKDEKRIRQKRETNRRSRLKLGGASVRELLRQLGEEAVMEIDDLEARWDHMLQVLFDPIDTLELPDRASESAKQCLATTLLLLAQVSPHVDEVETLLERSSELSGVPIDALSRPLAAWDEETVPRGSGDRGECQPGTIPWSSASTTCDIAAPPGSLPDASKISKAKDWTRKRLRLGGQEVTVGEAIVDELEGGELLAAASGAEFDRFQSLLPHPVPPTMDRVRLLYEYHNEKGVGFDSDEELASYLGIAHVAASHTLLHAFGSEAARGRAAEAATGGSVMTRDASRALRATCAKKRKASVGFAMDALAYLSDDTQWHGSVEDCVTQTLVWGLMTRALYRHLEKKGAFDALRGDRA